MKNAEAREKIAAGYARATAQMVRCGCGLWKSGGCLRCRVNRRTPVNCKRKVQIAALDNERRHAQRRVLKEQASRVSFDPSKPGPGLFRRLLGGAE